MNEKKFIRDITGLENKRKNATISKLHFFIIEGKKELDKIKKRYVYSKTF